VIEESPFLLGIVALDLRLKNLNRNLGKDPRVPPRDAVGKTAHEAHRSGEQAPGADAREYAPGRRSETDRILA